MFHFILVGFLTDTKPPRATPRSSSVVCYPKPTDKPPHHSFIQIRGKNGTRFELSSRFELTSLTTMTPSHATTTLDRDLCPNAH
ncbi:hypothetical protein JHK82_045631 [Glycine max]|uniref:Uncharacterized protein n=2 Tax=Glycine subgen. Soja TaxID=1462606 RepID=A0A0R0G2V6_SOYBN|nr:hypothetical protein JHK86_046062 [Glycine max]KAG4941958.1 hypothetical protein JHK87_045829 [Glycine soja]KAG4952737.1 hypothetical protein JHK85_046604 [Glycine max]KAG5100579.1 hypothetical protein JHK82_045631 [Glycine max]KAG5109162.1 hypothetical protein JHK84_046069 [Glycine max]